ncbi:MAG TPA: carbohydrate kinase family protein [Candidatus Saccharibacteria bacterium]|nr:carbohydrate kinase family protein [Candidatus Saccharibacteria bacterium]HRK94473.1 carbohydrate kinase family protein [Candidatus Saccharibacteria bacterium]
MSGKRPTILAIGAAVQDVFLSHSDEFEPKPDKPLHVQVMELEMGGKADVNKIDFSTGGGATNAAVTFARQNLHAIFMGTIGHDPAGKAVLDDLDKEGVDTRFVSYSDKLNTGYSVLLLAPNGERSILTYRGASTKYLIKNFNLDDVEADWLYVSTMTGNMNVLDHIFHQARQKGIKVFFNPGKGELKQPQLLKGLLEDVDVLSLNKEEAQQIVHGETSEELVRHLLHYVGVAIVSDGPDGVVASDGQVIIKAGMYRDVKVIDRTGAGDAFGSGFLSQWALGKSLKESIIFASANSTSVVTKIGAKAGILHADTKLHDMPLTETKF